jgi:four helix bundle protein
MTNKEFNEMFRKRTMAFVVSVLKFIETVPLNNSTKVMIYQLTKASTSVGANYRAYCRGRSRNERFSKICIVVEEADETLYWLELFALTNYGDQVLLAEITDENIEILKVVVSIKDSMYP